MLLNGIPAVGQAVGGGISFAAVLWFIKWLMEFMARRLDARHEKLNKQEERLDQSLAQRLKHLEQSEISSAARIGKLEQCVRTLLAEVQKLDPHNPTLLTVADVLFAQFAAPTQTPADMTDTLGRMK